MSNGSHGNSSSDISILTDGEYVVIGVYMCVLDTIYRIMEIVFLILRILSTIMDEPLVGESIIGDNIRSIRNTISIILFIGVLSLACNAFVMVVLLKGNTKFHAVHNILLLNIAISDLLLSSVAYPLWSSASFYGRWIWPDFLCTFSGFWCFMLAQTDMNTLAAIAICRYIIVCKSQYEFYLKQRNFKFYILGIIWGHSIITTSMPLFGWSSYINEAFGTSCSIDWTAHSPSVISYNVTIIMVCFIIHLVIFAYCYTNIISTFRVIDVIPNHPGKHQTLALERVVWYHKVATSRSVTVTSLSMVCVFLVAWTPYAMASVFNMAAGSSPVWLIVVPTMFAKSCTLLNPIACAFTSSKFRKAARQLIKSNAVRPTNSIELRETNPSSSNRPNSNRIRGESRTYHGTVTKDNIFIGQTSITLRVDNNLV